MSDLATVTREEIMALPEPEFRRLWGLFCSRVALTRKKSNGRRPSPDSLSAKLAGLDPGQSILFLDWTRTSRLNGTDQNAARRRLNDPGAKWSARLTNRGVRVTRVA